MSKRNCEICGSSSAVPVVYGMPSRPLVEKAIRGELVLGGCVIEERQPRWLCIRCADTEEEDPEEPGVAL